MLCILVLPGWEGHENRVCHYLVLRGAILVLSLVFLVSDCHPLMPSHSLFILRGPGEMLRQGCCHHPWRVTLEAGDMANTSSSCVEEPGGTPEIPADDLQVLPYGE